MHSHELHEELTHGWNPCALLAGRKCRAEQSAEVHAGSHTQLPPLRWCWSRLRDGSVAVYSCHKQTSSACCAARAWAARSIAIDPARYATTHTTLIQTHSSETATIECVPTDCGHCPFEHAALQTGGELVTLRQKVQKALCKKMVE
jgi:hypothetical protein